VRVAAVAPDVGYPQMVLRLGTPAEPIARRARRRDLHAVIES
jgi:hypothetical protein